jgi:hypothetical protein
MKLEIAQGESTASARGINWKNWGHWIICECEIDYVRRIVAYGFVTDVKVDPKSGNLQLAVTGPMGYPKDIPWLENFNPIAVDPFEIVQRVWAHLQSFSNANFGIEVTPASSGTQMLPGFGFDGSILSFDFFAIFIRAIDFPDCSDTIISLARDIPFDMFEEAQWDTERTEVTKVLRMAYPLGGLHQDHLSFQLGVNIIEAEKADEVEIEPVSDVIIRHWLPGKVMDSRLSNADPTRARRVVMEEDAYIDSTERAAAWAKRKLQRRNVPKHFSKIIINPHHSHAPFGSFWVGDSIRVQAANYPWFGEIDEWHRIISIRYSEADGMCELGLKAEGAWNYDPIEYNPDYASKPTEDPNRLANGYFADNLAGWISLQGQWIRVATLTYDETLNPHAGSVRIDHDDEGERFLSHRAWCLPGEHLVLQCAVRWSEVESGPTDAMQLVAFTSFNGTPVDSFVVDEHVNPTGVHGFELLQDTDWVVPEGVNEVALQFTVTPGVSAGNSHWTYARVYPNGFFTPPTSTGSTFPLTFPFELGG